MVIQPTPCSIRTHRLVQRRTANLAGVRFKRPPALSDSPKFHGPGSPAPGNFTRFGWKPGESDLGVIRLIAHQQDGVPGALDAPPRFRPASARCRCRGRAGRSPPPAVPAAGLHGRRPAPARNAPSRAARHFPWPQRKARQSAPRLRATDRRIWRSARGRRRRDSKLPRRRRRRMIRYRTCQLAARVIHARPVQGRGGKNKALWAFRSTSVTRQECFPWPFVTE